MRRPILIIAEAGVNHNGDYDLAVHMADIAKDAGADIVKFQTAVPELVMSRYAEKAEYQKTQTGAGESQLEMSKKFHLPLNAYKSLKVHCESIGIGFLSTPFDLPSIDTLSEIGVDTFKIPSGEITNLPYLEKIGRLRKRVILSSGMARLGEIEEAIAVLVGQGTSRDSLILMHCNTEYPTPYGDVNLEAMVSMRQAFRLPVGYSDHTLGLEVSIAAAAMGAAAIEKHFTIDKTLSGPDHKASLEPDELRALVRSIRNVEAALGDGLKRASASEQKNMVIARKSILAARDLKTGEIIDENDIIMKRPGDGISPMDRDRVLGRRLRKDVDADRKLSWSDFE